MTKVSNVVIHGEPITIDSQCVGERLAVYDKNKDGVLDAKDGLNDSQMAFKLVDAYGYELFNKPCSFKSQWSAPFSSNMVQELVYLLQTGRKLVSDVQTFESGLNVRGGNSKEAEAFNHNDYWLAFSLLEDLNLQERLNRYFDRTDTFFNVYLQEGLSDYGRGPNGTLEMMQLPFPSGIKTLIMSWIIVHNQFYDLVGKGDFQFECDAPWYTLNDSCDELPDTIQILSRDIAYPVILINGALQ